MGQTTFKIFVKTFAYLSFERIVQVEESFGHRREILQRKGLEEGLVGSDEAVHVDMGTYFLLEEAGGGSGVRRVPCKKDDMRLESLQFLRKHLVVRISADQDNEVEFSEKRQFIGVEGEPCVHTLLYHPSPRVGAEVLVVEDDIVLYKHVLELALVIKEIPRLCVISPVTSSVIMGFRNIQTVPLKTVVLGDLPADETQQGLEVDFPLPCKTLVYLCIISTVNEYSDGKIF